MEDYKLTTTKGWLETKQELAKTFKKWGVDEWSTTPSNQVEVTLLYILRGQEIRLVMGRQARASDNLRVLWLGVEAMRKNEMRGIDDVIKSAYLQLGSPITKDPWEILGIRSDSSIQFAESVYKIRAKDVHPDMSGSAEAMKELNWAIEELRKRSRE